MRAERIVRSTRKRERRPRGRTAARRAAAGGLRTGTLDAGTQRGTSSSKGGCENPCLRWTSSLTWSTLIFLERKPPSTQLFGLIFIYATKRARAAERAVVSGAVRVRRHATRSLGNSALSALSSLSVSLSVISNSSQISVTPRVSVFTTAGGMRMHAGTATTTGTAARDIRERARQSNVTKEARYV